MLGDAFGTVDPDTVATAVSELCRRHLGAPVAAYELFDGGVGTVHGVRLADGRRVAVKMHRSGADRRYLAAVREVQAAIAHAGMAARARCCRRRRSPRPGARRSAHAP